MATDILVLGPVEFSDWSAPESLPQGGRQGMNVHKLPGGRRVIDTMGPDDADISWSGKFYGATAMSQALTLDMLKSLGSPLPLLMTGNAYTVVISEFTYSAIRYPQYLTYSITCVVSSSFGIASLSGSIVASLDNLISSDLSSALSLF